MRYTPGRSGSRLRVASSSGVTPPMLGQVGRGHSSVVGFVGFGLARLRGRQPALGVDAVRHWLVVLTDSVPRSSSRKEPASSPSIVAATVVAGADQYRRVERGVPAAAATSAAVELVPPPHGVTSAAASPDVALVAVDEQPTLTGIVRPRLADERVRRRRRPAHPGGGRRVRRHDTRPSRRTRRSALLPLASVAVQVTVVVPTPK